MARRGFQQSSQNHSQSLFKVSEPLKSQCKTYTCPVGSCDRVFIGCGQLAANAHINWHIKRREVDAGKKREMMGILMTSDDYR